LIKKFKGDNDQAKNNSVKIYGNNQSIKGIELYNKDRGKLENLI
jgi:hypothetical protein